MAILCTLPTLCFSGTQLHVITIKIRCLSDENTQQSLLIVLYFLAHEPLDPFDGGGLEDLFRFSDAGLESTKSLDRFKSWAGSVSPTGGGCSPSVLKLSLDSPGPFGVWVAGGSETPSSFISFRKRRKFLEHD